MSLRVFRVRIFPISMGGTVTLTRPLINASRISYAPNTMTRRVYSVHGDRIRLFSVITRVISPVVVVSLPVFRLVGATWAIFDGSRKFTVAEMGLIGHHTRSDEISLPARFYVEGVLVIKSYGRSFLTV